MLLLYGVEAAVHYVYLEIIIRNYNVPISQKNVQNL